MSVANDRNGQAQGAKCGGCDDEDCSVCTDQLNDDLRAAICQINILTNKVKSLERVIVKQHKRLGELEVHSDSNSRGKHTNSRRKHRVKASKSKKKHGRVECEKQRHNNGEESEGEVTSEVEYDLSSKGRKSEGKLKSSKTKASSKQTPVYLVSSSEDEDSSESSFSSNSNSCEGSKKYRRKRRVKSGAEVKKRPVLQTELWPHTIANENEGPVDGEDVLCENISLAKFLVCFTYIMNTCSRQEEIAGRSELLHAVSSILECLPWTEARLFHNLVMVKVEQRRMTWRTKFSIVADKFIEKKVRLLLRKQLPLDNRTAHKNNSSYENFSSQNNKSSNLNLTVCKEYNFSSCTWGDKCRFKHICWSCAEEGNAGELHRASSHNNTGSSDRQEQGRWHF